MNAHEATTFFDDALHGRLDASRRADFEDVLAAEPELAAAFERFADDALSGAPGDLLAVHALLERAGNETPGVALSGADLDAATRRIEHLVAETSARGRLYRLVAGTGVLAAAASIVILLSLPPKAPFLPNDEGKEDLLTVDLSGLPAAAPGLVDDFGNGYRYLRSAARPFVPAAGVKAFTAPGTLLALDDDLLEAHSVMRLIEGRVTLAVEDGRWFTCASGEYRFSAIGPAEFALWAEATAAGADMVSANPWTAYEPFTDGPTVLEEATMHRSRYLATIGALGAAVSMNVLSGRVSAESPTYWEVHDSARPFASALIQSGGADKDDAVEEKRDPETFLKERDKNGDGVLDRDEVRDEVLTHGDANGDGVLDLDELRALKEKREARRDERKGHLFEELDRNGDGRLDKEEVGERAIERGDTNGDGFVSRDEFDARLKRMREGKDRPDAEDVFRHLDENGDGVLDAKEAPARMMEKADANKDGKIDRQEFEKAAKELREHRRDHHDAHPEKIFEHLDKNKDGKLDKDEAPGRLLEKADDNKDGVVDRDEFLKHAKELRADHEHDGKREREVWAATFKRLDKNGDGVLDATEAPRVVEHADENKDGKVDKDEFMKAGAQLHRLLFGPGGRDEKDGEKGPEELFKHLDKNGDGVLDATEAPRVVEHADENKDGKVDLEEFKKAKDNRPHGRRGPPPGRGPGGPGRGPGNPGKPGGPGKGQR